MCSSLTLAGDELVQSNPDKRDTYLEGLTQSHEILLKKTRNQFLRGKK